MLSKYEKAKSYILVEHEDDYGQYYGRELVDEKIKIYEDYIQQLKKQNAEFIDSLIEYCKIISKYDFDINRSK